MSIVAGEKFELRLIRSTDIHRHEDSEADRTTRLARRFRKDIIRLLSAGSAIVIC